MIRTWVFFWAWLNFIRYRISPVCKISLAGILNCYAISLVCTLSFGLLAAYVAGTGEGMSDHHRGILLSANPLTLFIAGIEDFIFVLPIFVLSKRFQLLGLVVSSVLFTLGHSYQGDAMYAKLITVPLVFLLARRYGIFSTAFAHGLNDVIAVAMMQYLYKKHSI